MFCGELRLTSCKYSKAVLHGLSDWREHCVSCPVS